MIRQPYPISANKYWRMVGGSGRGGGPGRIVVSEEAKKYKRQVGALARLHGFSAPDWPAPKGIAVEVCIQLHPRSVSAATARATSKLIARAKATGPTQAALRASEVVLDLDNALKVTLDALNGVAWDDDSQVKRITAEYGPPCEGGGLTVWVGRIRADDTSSVCPVSAEFA